MDINRMAQIKVAHLKTAGAGAWIGKQLDTPVKELASNALSFMGNTAGKWLGAPLLDAVGSAARHSDAYGNNLLLLKKFIKDELETGTGAITAEIERQAEQAAKQMQIATLAGGLMGTGGGLAGGLAAGGITGIISPLIDSRLNPGIDFKNLPPEMQEKINVLVKRSL